ncbi:MAG TPA: hypothetical protein VKU02_22395 [Gemmataceae bacterium]|nr:hypothetical protein [Gemmataceae bacterium]
MELPGTRKKEQGKRNKSQSSKPFAFGLLPFAFCLAGCVSVGSFVNPGAESADNVPCQVVAAWNPAVVKTPDPVHDGDETPGLVGRIYLFGADVGCPLLGDGTLCVTLYDDTAGPAPKGTPPLEEWQFDHVTLKRLQRRDPIGWGYTVFLPWGTYRPEINRVHLKVRYTPQKGGPLFAASAPMTLGDSEPLKKATTSVAQNYKRNEPVRSAVPVQTVLPVQAITPSAGQPRP